MFKHDKTKQPDEAWYLEIEMKVANMIGIDDYWYDGKYVFYDVRIQKKGMPIEEFDSTFEIKINEGMQQLDKNEKEEWKKKKNQGLGNVL